MADALYCNDGHIRSGVSLSRLTHFGFSLRNDNHSIDYRARFILLSSTVRLTYTSWYRRLLPRLPSSRMRINSLTFASSTAAGALPVAPAAKIHA